MLRLRLVWLLRCRLLLRAEHLRRPNICKRMICGHGLRRADHWLGHVTWLHMWRLLRHVLCVDRRRCGLGRQRWLEASRRRRGRGRRADHWLPKKRLHVAR